MPIPERYSTLAKLQILNVDPNSTMDYNGRMVYSLDSSSTFLFITTSGEEYGDGTWQSISASGGTPAGLDGTVQINDSNAFGSIPGSDGTSVLGSLSLDEGSFAALGNINVNSLATPSAPTVADIATGGTLLANTQYCYKIAANTDTATTLASTEACVTTANDGNDTHSISVDASGLIGALGALIYGRTTGAELSLNSVSVNAGVMTQYIDTGADTPTDPLPTENLTASFTIDGGANGFSLTQNSLNLASVSGNIANFVADPDLGPYLDLKGAAGVEFVLSVDPAAVGTLLVLHPPLIDATVAGQPLVSDAAGNLSFAAGITHDCAGVPTAITIVGGVITAVTC
jgi:hypothetical protein